jgi:hypothetical protein
VNVTETQTFETSGGQAAPAQQTQEMMLPPQLKERFDALRVAIKHLRKEFKPTTAEGKKIKQELSNFVLPEMEAAFLILGQAFTETFQLFSYLQADFQQMREHVLSRVGGAPLVDGNVSDEQIADTRRALAQIGLLLAQDELDRDALNEAFNEVLACFNDMLDIDLSPYDDDDRDEDDDDDEGGDDHDDEGGDDHDDDDDDRGQGDGQGDDTSQAND